MQPYTPPEFKKTAFHCPNCKAYAKQTWCSLTANKIDGTGNFHANALILSQCSHCNDYTIWFHGNMIYPDTSVAPNPNPDLPAEIVNDYMEARAILARSPRGAAALFRLCIQKLCSFLGEPGKNLNTDIASLVKKGLNPKIQKSLDVVRVIGNESVHPGTIDLRDQPETAIQLANLVNIIADAMITQPKMIDELYGKLPEAKREEIDRRDG